MVWTLHQIGAFSIIVFCAQRIGGFFTGKNCGAYCSTFFIRYIPFLLCVGDLPCHVICGDLLCQQKKPLPYRYFHLYKRDEDLFFSVVPLFLTQRVRPLITSDNVYSANGEYPAQPTDTGQCPSVPPAARGPVILNALLSAHTSRRLSAMQNAFSFLPVKAFFMIHQQSHCCEYLQYSSFRLVCQAFLRKFFGFHERR